MYMVLYGPNFSLMFSVHLFLYVGVYCEAFKEAKSRETCPEHRRLGLVSRTCLPDRFVSFECNRLGPTYLITF